MSSLRELCVSVVKLVFPRVKRRSPTRRRRRGANIEDEDDDENEDDWRWAMIEFAANATL